MSRVDETERQLEEWLEDTARPMPQYVMESSLETVARTPQVSPGGPFGIPWLNRPLVAIATAAAVVLTAVSIGPGLVERWGSSGPGGPRAPTCSSPPAGLVGWWPGDGSVADITGVSDGELVGGATFAPGRVAQGFQLDGDGDFVDVADDPALDVGRRDFSVAVWTWFDDLDGEQILVEKWVQGVGVASGWTLTKLETNALGFFTEDGLGGAHGTSTDPLDLPARSWLHIVARRNGGTVDLFMDGVRVSTDTTESAGLDLETDSSIKFGHRGAPGDTPGSQDPNGYFLGGVIDEVQLVVGRAVTEDEIRAMYAAGAAGSCKS